MNIRSHALSLLEKVAAEFPEGALSGPLQFDENDECYLTLEDDIAIAFYLDEESSSLILNLPVGPLPEDETRETIMLELLKGNYSWGVTEGGTLGVDKGTNLICLNYLVALPLADEAQMPGILNKLISVVLHWRREISEIAAGAMGDAEMSTTMLRA